MVFLDKLFNPSAVAIIGASDQKGKLGYSLVKNLLAGKARKIYPVNPGHKNILGRLCFASVKDIPGAVDVALVAVKSQLVPQVLTECGQKKIPLAIVISAGFKESGENGKNLEEQIKTIAQKYKIKIVGPNCLGIIDLHSSLNASFAAGVSAAGPVAFLSQSGAIGTALLDWAETEYLGFSKFISLGNEAGLTENDFLEYLAQDKKTKAVLMYLEGVSDGAKFIKTAKQISKIKPVVALKAGWTSRGSEAIASHTGSLASAGEVFEAACRQAGIFSVRSLRALFNFAKIFNAGIYKPLRRLAIVTNGGGPSIVMADLIEAAPHLELVKFSEGLKNKLRQVLPPAAAVGNPVDLMGDAPANRYDEVLKILTKEKDVDGLVVILTPQQMTEVKETAEVLVKYSKFKPIIPLFIGEETTRVGEELLKKNHLGNFEYPQDVEEVLSAMSFKNKIETTPAPQPEIPTQTMDLLQTQKLFKSYGLDFKDRLVEDKKNLKKFFSKIKAPMALKVYSPQVIHKSDVGGVKINLNSLAEAEQAWNQITSSVKAKEPGAQIKGMLLSPQALGHEVLIGMKRDSNFGPVIVFGLGGIFVEILKDVSRRVAPLSPIDADEMMAEIKGYKLLTGARGQKPVNLSALRKIILAVSKMSLEHPEIKSLDLNPVIVNEKEAYLVDVRVII